MRDIPELSYNIEGRSVCRRIILKIAGFLFYDNDEWILSTNENKRYHLNVENAFGVNESDFWELFGIKVVIWGFTNGNGVIRVHTIMECDNS